MRIFHLIFSLLLATGIVSDLSAAELPLESPISQGTDYRKLDSRQFEQVTDLTQLQQIPDIELFYWYGCADCQKVEKRILDYLQSHPQITYRRTPLVALVEWRAQAYLQPLLEQLEGKVTIPTSDELYQQCLEDCSVLSSYEASLDWLKQRYQIKELPYIDEAKIWRTEKKNAMHAETFSISQVPSIIIREQYVTDANSAKTLDRLIKIVDHLLNKSG